MPAPSLKHLATATAIKHVKLLTDIGNLPYALARPILMKVDNPEKLHSMELLSPHLAEEDQEIWLELIKRDIPRWNTYDIPTHTNRWYEIYCDLQAEVQRELDADAEKMKMAIDGIKSERAQLQPKVVSQLPRGVRASRPRMAPRGVYVPRSGGLLAPEAKKKAAIFAPQRRNAALAVPTKHLSTRATQIKKAPRSLIEEHRRPVEQAVSRRENQSIVPGRLPVPGRAGSASSSTSARLGSDLRVSSSLAEREARLKAIASGKPLPPKPLPSSPAAATATTPNPHDSPSTAQEAPSPVKRAIPKRRATSPPPQTHSPSPSQPSIVDSPSGGRPDSTSEPAARPAIVRKRPEVDIFLRPKKRRVA
ncbi:putative RNA polymerase II transcription factor SIII (Elongin) subunit A [Penicillium brasilianum]|uniref:Putative RNA polymerase II transcription factor SIII (Elongin) subunit A n=1 Tax=Penicillium brasilianum TaxID=104259 RepID=A0A1S9RTF2_PENBI|nr:putative RNA polymerase II transcription factor SIII (Elongin) subunit A [Penicillium brasilianum]